MDIGIASIGILQTPESDKSSALFIRTMFKNKSKMDFNLSDLTIKSKNAEFGPCTEDLQGKVKYKPKKLKSNKTTNIGLFKQIKKKKQPIGKCNATFVVSKYFFRIKVPTEFQLN